VSESAIPSCLEIIDFIATGTTPEAVAGCRHSPEAERRISELIPRERGRPDGRIALLTHSHAAGLGIVPANDEGKQEHDARRNGQKDKRVDVGEGHRLP
jgi:hypothetical protein